MKAKVHPALTELLKNRLYISRNLKSFTIEDLANNWGVASRTLFRYDSPHDRELSRIQAKRATEAYKAINKNLCQICDKPLQGHKRCPDCTMLIHGHPECSCESNCIVVTNSSSLLIRIKRV